MSRYYRMLSLLDVDAALPENEQDFWKDVLARCTECPSDVLEEGDESCDSDSVDVYSCIYVSVMFRIAVAASPCPNLWFQLWAFVQAS